MKRIVVLPLDERPCNLNFNYMMALDTDYEVIRPSSEILGDKKIPGNVVALWKWLEVAAEGADGLIISIDTLLYGGIVPSRLHHYSEEELKDRLFRIRVLKNKHPELKIFAYSLIMRNPTYSSDEEEPNYYAEYGREIHRFGYISHKIELGIASTEELNELESINKCLPKQYIDDYMKRREINGKMNKLAIDLVEEGIIDFMIIPQDDASAYGVTAKDQKIIRQYIYDKKLALKVYMYPDADAVANTLLARYINEDKNLKPLVYVKYTSSMGSQLIPLYEDRLLGETIKYQILAAGGLAVTSVSEADIVLIVNTPSGNMIDASEANLRSIEYDAFRTLVEAVEYADYVINNLKKPCIVGDVAYCNGSDLQFVQLLSQKGLLFKLASYAGWNTSSNSLGTCIPHGMIYNIYGNTQAHKDFLALRYIEDAGFCALVRQKVCLEYLPALNINFMKLQQQRGEVADIVKKELENFIEEYLGNEQYKINILDCYLPWRRMFEIGLIVQAIDK